MTARPVTGAVGDAEHHDQKRREQQQNGCVVRETDAEAHHAVGRRARAGDDRETEDEQRVGEQRTENGRLCDDDLTCGQREQDDEELGQVAERRLQDTGCRRPEAGGDGLGADADDPGEACECQPGDHEGEHGGARRVVQDARDHRQHEGRDQQDRLSVR